MKPGIRIQLIVIVMATTLLSISALAQEKKVEKVSILTSAVCGDCKVRIENGLAYTKGIKDVNLDLETKVATVKYSTSRTSVDEIRKAISKLGYDADDVPADSVAYSKLPACCKKDAKPH